MAVEFICDGCGKRHAGDSYNGHHFKPSHWYQRSDGDGVQVACSRECIDKLWRTTGKSPLVAPF